MEISKGKVVTIHYTLKDDSGKIIDTSKGNDPLSYLHGYNNIVIGLEKELEQKKVGDSVQTVVSPNEGYGQFNEKLIFSLKRNQFPKDENLEEGMQFQADIQGQPQIFSIKEIQNDEIIVDGNHPLAGETLHFEVKVEEVREASTEEIKHGHAH
jgi:FKBP-type peptidyl-prolyl cis-trans isomerase SlyD